MPWHQVPAQDFNQPTLISSSTESSQTSSSLSVSFEDPHQGWETVFQLYVRRHVPGAISNYHGNCSKPIIQKGQFLVKWYENSMREIQKHKNRFQDMDQCTFISRMSALSHVILRTTLHQVSPSSVIKSKLAKHQSKHHCKLVSRH